MCLEGLESVSLPRATLTPMPEPQQSDPINPGDWFSQLRQSYSQVQLGPGVVGKTTRATLGLLAVWLLVIFRFGGDLLMNSFLLGAGVIATMVYCWWVHRTHAFAEANPQVALLEGAQLIEYKKWEASVNGVPVPASLPVPDPEAPVRIELER